MRALRCGSPYATSRQKSLIDKNSTDSQVWCFVDRRIAILLSG